MKPKRQFLIFETIILSIGLSAALCESKGESDTEKKIEEYFKVRWSSVNYTKRVTIDNTEDSENQQQDVSESVSLFCEVDILDPDLILGISRATEIDRMTDDKGGDIQIDPRSSSSFQSRYEALRYDRKFVPPTRPAKWKTVVRSVLRLPPEDSSRPRWVEQVRPSRMQIDLDVDLKKQAVREISSVKGKFYALLAESYENIDVPFKPSDDWVRLTPNMEIQLKEATCTGSHFRFNIEARPGGGSMRSLSVNDYLPKRLVVERQFIGEDGEPTSHFRGFRHLPAHITGSGSGGGSNCKIKSIRFVIAVNPAHYEIPFVLENIPLPEPDGELTRSGH